MGVLKTVARAVLGEKGADTVNDVRNAWRISRSPDRAVLRRTLLPAFASMGGRVLWVGCRRYTARYPALLAAGGAEVWTSDIDPAAERWGAPDRHRTGDLRQIDGLFSDTRFDAVLCNGVLGYGVDAVDDQREALSAIGSVMKPGGRLLLGWNTDKIDDPLRSGVLPTVFTPDVFGGATARTVCPPTTHVYDLFRRL